MVSVVVNNFNYADFLTDAIESALAQQGRETEVIVVDDGSTDGSRDIIRRYEESVRVVLKANGGQASAFNAGFEASRGDIVVFLDADDVLLPDTSIRLSTLFATRPEIVKAHYRLELINARGRPIGSYVPSLRRELPDGDIQHQVLTAPDDIPYPPTSGNAFSAAALRRLLPMPEGQYRRLADVYLVNLVPLLGPVACLDGIGGFYRTHGRNLHYGSGVDLERIRATIEASASTHRHLVAFAGSLGLTEASGARCTSVTDLVQRLISLRLDPRAHPIAGDRPATLAAKGIEASLRRMDIPLTARIQYAGWFAANALAPRRVVRRLAEQLFAAWADSPTEGL